jgi:hypothetical protein
VFEPGEPSEHVILFIALTSVPTRKTRSDHSFDEDSDVSVFSDGRGEWTRPPRTSEAFGRRPLTGATRIGLHKEGKGRLVTMGIPFSGASFCVFNLCFERMSNQTWQSSLQLVSSQARERLRFTCLTEQEK